MQSCAVAMSAIAAVLTDQDHARPWPRPLRRPGVTRGTGHGIVRWRNGLRTHRCRI